MTELKTLIIINYKSNCRCTSGRNLEKTFYFHPTTQEKDVDADDDAVQMFNSDKLTEDDILYAQPTTIEGKNRNTLLFVHQSVEQLAILKRYFMYQVSESNLFLSTRSE